MYSTNIFLKVLIYFICSLIFINSCTKTPAEPEQQIECPEGYHTCMSNGDTLTCCPDELPATVTQTHVNWPGLADTPWPMFMYDPQHTGRSPYDGPSLGEVEWEQDLGREIFSNPVIDQLGNIIVNTRHDVGGNQKLVSVNQNGVINWEIQFGGHFDSTPLISYEGDIYCCFSDQVLTTGYLAKINTIGDWVWTYKLGKLSKTDRTTYSPNISIDGKTIYIAGFDSSLFAISTNGNLNWKMSLPQETINGELTISPNGETLYLFTNMNRIVAADTSGQINWTMQLGEPSQFMSGDNTYNRSTLCAPTVDSDGNIYIYSNIGMHAISPEGYIRWEYPFGLYGVGFNNGITIGPYGGIFMTKNGYSAVYNYDGSLRWEKIYWNQNRLIIDKQGNSYFGVFSSREYTPDQSIINFISFKPDGSIRYMTRLGPNSYTPDIDSPLCIGLNNFGYIGSDGGPSHPIFKIK